MPPPFAILQVPDFAPNLPQVKDGAIMAAPELQNTTPVAGESAEPAANPEAAPVAPVAGGESHWFEEFERVEKVFYILAAAMFFSALVTYVGLRLENNPVFIAGALILGATLVGMAGLMLPLAWVFLKGFRHWRRRRAAGSDK